MDKFKIQGGAPLSGELPVSGSKNAALPVLAACLLTDEPVILHRLPQVKDIAVLRAELVSTLEETRALFAGEMPARLMEMTVSHPILGSNNVVKIFQLMSAHEERHHGQMRTVLANPGLPKG